MPTVATIAVNEISLDLKNFRTVAQSDEYAALHAMISIAPDWFFALTDSLLEDGYLPTESIIILEVGTKKIVKEGNRRIGALKMILGQITSQGLPVPSEILAKISKITPEWKITNASVPCAIYQVSEEAVVKRIVSRTHGKGEKAGRDNWRSVARARHNRDEGGSSEPGLDLLEKYLKNGQNLTAIQAERWAGDFPLTVLDEAIRLLAPRLGCVSSRDLVDKYPNGDNRGKLEFVILDIGSKALTFDRLRDKQIDFGISYGISALAVTTPVVASTTTSPAGPSSPNNPGPTGPISNVNVPTNIPRKLIAVSLTDPKSVMRGLRKFTPKGNNREKLVRLLIETRNLKLHKHPHSFCFLLRSMFEISAKAYCKDHAATGGPQMTKSGVDRNLVDVLKDITSHLTNNKSDKAMLKVLHGAIAELAKGEGFLSVTSMNQLIHNPTFSVDETHICTLFHNVFPLLEAMNQ